ncbi:hypothetical protein P8452_77484 [Trifolium repens]|nr:hypothetical protein P8452_77484 [Trifolium repens]
MADLQQKLDALKGLVGVLNSMDDGEENTQNGSPSTPRNYNQIPLPGRNRSKGKYNNSGKQNIKGLSNQTGFTEGNANGAINFGDLRM